MRRHGMMVLAAVAAAGLAGAVLAMAASEQGGGRPRGARSRPPAAQFDDQGRLMLPNYRMWVFVGAPVTPNSLNGGKAEFPEIHDVYIDRAAYEQFRRTGEFPEGTVFVKELIDVGATEAASGKGFFPGTKINGVAASVLSSERFADRPDHLGFFHFAIKDNQPEEKGELQPVAACNDCHKQHASQQGVFLQYYPVLEWAKPTQEPKASD